VTRLLLTAFAPWTAQQPSNSADDLLQAIQPIAPASIYFLRGLPVNSPVARSLTIAKLEQVQPQILVLCGMAETRTRLSVEKSARVGDRQLHTAIDLVSLTVDLATTDISQDAGRFVCNSLYYAMLNYRQLYLPTLQCLFVHVPILQDSSRAAIVADFRVMLERLATG
jgi:pyroglutamyl-peptidase